MSIKTYLMAGYSCLYAVSYEEDRIAGQIAGVADQLGYDLWEWTLTNGLVNRDGTVLDKTSEPLAALAKFIEYNRNKDNEPEGTHIPNKSIVILKDLHMYLKAPQPILIRRLKEAIAIGRASNRHLIILGATLHLPPELEKEIKVVNFELPTREELFVVAESIAKDKGIPLNGNRDPILDAMSGLTLTEAADAAAYAVVCTNDLDPVIISKIKAENVKKGGVLEIINTDMDLSRIGGLVRAKAWINKRAGGFTTKAKDYRLKPARGVLAIGISGCGKTLFAKAIAKVLGGPLLKLDGGKIFGSLVGQSEENMRIAIATAEAIAPCTLMIDEMEKAFPGKSGGGDSGTSDRVLGTFLQWMSDKVSQVFVVGTANNVTSLPPELLRKGRFDQLFFVDLPDIEERAEIWRIHISGYGREADNYNLSRLAALSEGYTGAEIESAVTDGLWESFYGDTEPTDDTFEQSIKSSIPISKTMEEQIEAMRRWADGRAIRASGTTVKQTKTKLNRKIG